MQIPRIATHFTVERSVRLSVVCRIHAPNSSIDSEFRCHLTATLVAPSNTMCQMGMGSMTPDKKKRYKSPAKTCWCLFIIHQVPARSAISRCTELLRSSSSQLGKHAKNRHQKPTLYLSLAPCSGNNKMFYYKYFLKTLNLWIYKYFHIYLRGWVSTCARSNNLKFMNPLLQKKPLKLSLLKNWVYVQKAKTA